MLCDNRLIVVFSLWCVGGIVSSCRPSGVFEWDAFAGGSRAVLDAVIESTKQGATSVIGTLDIERVQDV